MPTPGTSATPGLRPGLGKPPAMEPLVNQAGRALPLILLFCFSYFQLDLLSVSLMMQFPREYEMSLKPPSFLSLKKGTVRNRCLSLGFSSCTLFGLQLFTFSFSFISK
jgi:hypothetical protein